MTIKKILKSIDHRIKTLQKAKEILEKADYCEFFSLTWEYEARIDELESLKEYIKENDK